MVIAAIFVLRTARWPAVATRRVPSRRNIWYTFVLPSPRRCTRIRPPVLQFAQVIAHRTHAHVEVAGQSLLAGKAGVLLPRVTQQQRIGQLGPVRQSTDAEDVVRQLRKAGAQTLVLDDDRRRCLLSSSGALLSSRISGAATAATPLTDACPCAGRLTPRNLPSGGAGEIEKACQGSPATTAPGIGFDWRDRRKGCQTIALRAAVV